MLIGITLLGVGLSAAVTLWSQVLQREREAELLFRGEAVVRALERFGQDRPGTLPETLDELVEGKYLRRAWLDPMTGRSFPHSPRRGRARDRRFRARPERGGRPGSGPAPTNPAGEAEPRRTAGRAGREERGEAGAAAESTTGITGVVSTSDLLSFRAYEAPAATASGGSRRRWEPRPAGHRPWRGPAGRGERER